MTTRNIDDIKRKLLAERERVLESIRRGAEHVMERDDTTQDEGDLAAASHDRGVFFSLQESDAKQLKMIDDVLARIGDDEFGMCERCGDMISKTRLDAVPWATRCISCQELADLEAITTPAGAWESDMVTGLADQ